MAFDEAAHQAGAFVVTEVSAAVQRKTMGDAPDQSQLSWQTHFSPIKIVVCADGLLRTSLHALPLMRTSHDVNSRVGVGAVFEPQTVTDSLRNRLPHHRITMIVERHGYVGLTWAEGGRLSVAGHWIRNLSNRRNP